MEQFDKSLVHFQTVYKMSSASKQAAAHLARVHHNYGASLAAEGKLRKAAEEFKKAIEYLPEFEEAKRALQQIEEVLIKE